MPKMIWLGMDVHAASITVAQYEDQAPTATVQTIANAMDVGHPSNFERMLWLYDGDLDAMRRDISATVHTDQDVRDTIRRVYESHGLDTIVTDRTTVATLLTAGTNPAGNANYRLTFPVTDGFIYVIAVRRGSATSRVGFNGLPRALTGGEVLFEYNDQTFRTLSVANGGFRDWFAQHDARVYRFQR